MAAGEFRTISMLSLVDECHRQIREQILSGDLEAGAPLRDSVIARAMGVSRSPVREALRRLEQSRLVEKSNNHSYRVAGIDEGDAAELAALRMADEGLAVRIIVRDRLDVSHLEPLIDALADPESGSRPAAEADAAFHTAVVATVRMPRLDARYADLTDQIRLMLLSNDVSPVLDSATVHRHHVELYEGLRAAIASGDPSEVLARWQWHVEHGMNDPARVADRG
ncbi:GntR family transcriptional regulator [Pseudonocardia kongjuensis]|uniref:GntR family transcriptional regulator n=1 Tax=Pseudonocardia kongjuensis TaxID=102227 RepID=A0ABN1Y541_9PSEU